MTSVIITVNIASISVGGDVFTRGTKHIRLVEDDILVTLKKFAENGYIKLVTEEPVVEPGVVGPVRIENGYENIICTPTIESEPIIEKSIVSEENIAIEAESNGAGDENVPSIDQEIFAAPSPERTIRKSRKQA